MHRSRSLLTATRGKRILHLPHAQPYSLSATRGTMVSRKGTRPSRNFCLRFGPQENSFPPTLVFSNILTDNQYRLYERNHMMLLILNNEHFEEATIDHASKLEIRKIMYVQFSICDLYIVFFQFYRFNYVR